MQNYLPYCFTDYSDFLIANSPYSFPRKSHSGIFNFGSIQSPKTLSFRGSEHTLNSLFLGVMFTSWFWVFDVVLSKIKKTNEQFFFIWISANLINNKINRPHKSTYKEFFKKIDNSISVHQRNTRFLTVELFKVLNGYSRELMLEAFSLNDVSVLNADVLSQWKMSHSLIFLVPKIYELVRSNMKNSGLLKTFKSVIRLETVFKTT